MHIDRHPRALGAILAALAVAACATPQPSTVPTTTDASPAAAATSPTTRPSVHPSISPAPSEGSAPAWDRVTILSDEGGWDTAMTVVRGTDRYLALGLHYEPGGDVGYYFGSQLWSSLDGASWERISLPPEAIGAHALVTTPQGEFVLFANRQGEAGSQPIVMRSADGHGWQAVEAGLPEALWLGRVVSGALGYLLAAGENGAQGLWRSSDGLSWEPAYALAATAATSYEVIVDIAAGDEGFVALAMRGLADDSSDHFVIASADGVEWFEAARPFEPDELHSRPGVIAALGGDWVATIDLTGKPVRFWRSSDGLVWYPAGTIEGPSHVTPFLGSAGGQLYFSHAATGAPVGRPGGWTSSDGITWTRIELGAGGVLAGAFDGPDGVILAGSVVISPDVAAAAFWRPQ